MASVACSTPINRTLFNKNNMRILEVGPFFSSYKTTLKQQLKGGNEIRVLICF